MHNMKKTKMQNLLIRFYYFICSILLKHTRLIVLVISIFVSFIMNSLYLEAATVVSGDCSNALILKLTEEYNRTYREPLGLAPIQLTTIDLRDIIIESESEEDFCHRVNRLLNDKATRNDCFLNFEFYQKMSPTVRCVFLTVSVSVLFLVTVEVCARLAVAANIVTLPS